MSSKYILVESTVVSRADYVARCQQHADVAAELEHATVLLLPNHLDPTTGQEVFAPHTLDFQEHVRDAGISVAIAAADVDYREVLLHADDVFLTAFLANAFSIPLIVNVISAWVYERLKGRVASQVPTLKSTFYVEEPERKAKFVYDGPADKYAESVAAAMATVFEKGK